MRQFNVPQFIEVEDKIFGPLTFKQFIYLLGGAAAVFVIYVFGGMIGVIFLGIPMAALALALAFYKINNRPFINVATSAVSYYTKSKLYIWKKREVKKQKIKGGTPYEQTQFLPQTRESKLKDLAWSLDVKQKIK